MKKYIILLCSFIFLSNFSFYSLYSMDLEPESMDLEFESMDIDTCSEKSSASSEENTLEHSESSESLEETSEEYFIYLINKIFNKNDCEVFFKDYETALDFSNSLDNFIAELFDFQTVLNKVVLKRISEKEIDKEELKKVIKQIVFNIIKQNFENSLKKLLSESVDPILSFEKALFCIFIKEISECNFDGCIKFIRAIKYFYCDISESVKALKIQGYFDSQD